MSVSEQLPTVLPPSALDALADRLDLAAGRIESAMTDAADRWGRLHEVFDVRGAEGAYDLLDRPARASQDFAEALHDARDRLASVARESLPDLLRRREALAARIEAVDVRATAAALDVAAAEARFVRARDAEDAETAMPRASRERLSAWADQHVAETAVGELEGEIARLRRDVEQVEEGLASSLRGISGGDTVSDAGGGAVGIAQSYWGASRALYPGAAGAAIGLEERFTRSLSDASARRISWMGRATRDDVRAWVESHPDFAAAVGMVDPAKAQRLWAQTEPASAAQLFALAPFAIGNLNGISSVVKNRFNRESLDRMLARDDLRGDYRAHLEKLEEKLDEPGGPKLLSLFQETVDGSPRASIGWGDIDGADQITTLSHGITEDLAAFPDWAHSAQTMQTEVAKRTAATTATVLFMEWDSGDIPEVEHIERPDNGAVRLSHLLHGFRAQNPDSQLDLGLHSLGTTMGAQMMADNPRLVSNAWFYGSAGISGHTARELERQMDAGELVIHATYAHGDGMFSGDRVAPVGRMGEHPVDPADIDGVRNFSSEGGLVGDVGNGEPVITARGDRTDGHNSQRSNLPYYRAHPLQVLVDPIGALLSPWQAPAVGYLDPDSQSFRQSVVDIAHTAETPRSSN
ncbi:alpha/beta hydrolase [Microbacterium sp. NPDC090225]|uniref:alpha/beta hydrolase n=1 Tax=Microbacterium sp. NPDC090225 TaxID=3364207 RepID=UPI00381B1626